MRHFNAVSGVTASRHGHCGTGRPLQRDRGRCSTLGRPMSEATRLSPAQLRQCCDASSFAFATTEELEELEEIFGQQRAKEAAAFGIGIRREGYNLYVLGPAGAGKQTLLRQLVSREAVREGAPADWCYVFNFDQPHQPRALQLPAGRGVKLRDDMSLLLDELLAAIPAAFDSDEYRARTEQIDAEFTERAEKAFRELAELASNQGIALLRLPTGFSLAPVKKDGEVVSPEEFAQLPSEERERIEKVIGELQGAASRSCCAMRNGRTRSIASVCASSMARWRATRSARWPTRSSNAMPSCRRSARISPRSSTT